VRWRLTLAIALGVLAAADSTPTAARPVKRRKAQTKPETKTETRSESEEQVTEEPAPEPERYDLDHEPPWHWQQILATPRIGGRMTYVAVDRTNPDRIFVGTEEGTIVRSIDGGITWDERPLSPFVVQARSIGLAQVEGPDLSNKGRGAYDPPSFGDPESAALEYGLGTPDQESAADLGLLFDSVIFKNFPIFFSTNIPQSVNDVPPNSTLLQDAIASRRDEQVPVQTIAICPGALFPLLVATTREVYGSADDGITSIRLFFITGNIRIEQIACSPHFPNEISVATNAGLVRSTDGGLSFNPVLTGWPGVLATSVAYSKDPKTGKVIIYEGAEEEVYAGDPDSQFGLEYRYPEKSQPTAPWVDIHSIDATDDGEVWLGTEDGVRVSRDYGQTFEIAGPALFNNQSIIQVFVGQNDGGGPRIAVLIKDALYASDDDGENWFTFFHGATRRSLRRVAGAGISAYGVARWWLVSNGELYTTVPPKTRARARIDASAKTWAKKELERTPSLQLTIARVLEETHLSPAQIDALIRGELRRRYVPQIDLKLTAASESVARLESQAITRDRDVQANTDRQAWQVLVQLTWPVPEGYLYPEEISPIRNALYEMRRQIAFAAEDAWHERVLHLEQLARGMSENYQIEILRARVEALEVVLDTWGWAKPVPLETQGGPQ
jgi:hypothetical protein